MLTREEESALCAEIQRSSNQDEAMARLVAVYGSLLRGSLRPGTRSDADLQEIENETWLSVWRAIRRSWDPARAPLIYLIRLKAVQAAISYYRNNWYKGVVILHEDLRLQRERLGEAGVELDVIDDRQIAGEDPVMRSGLTWDAMERALRIAFDPDVNEVHESAVFGFNRLLRRKPAELVTAPFVESPMPSLTNMLVDDLCNESGIPVAVLLPLFENLRAEARSEAWRDVTLALRFQQQPPQKDISRWSDNVFRRLDRRREDLLGGLQL